MTLLAQLRGQADDLTRMMGMSLKTGRIPEHIVKVALTDVRTQIQAVRKTREREVRPEYLTSGNSRRLPTQRRKRKERFGEEGQVCTEHTQQSCLCKSCTHWNLKRGTGRSLYKEDISRHGTRQEDQQRRGPGLSSRPNTTWYCPSQAFYWPLNLNFLNKKPEE